MTNQQHPDQFDWATELLDAEGHVTLSAQEAHEIGARLRSMGEKLKAYEDLDEAASDVQLLRMGYAAARLEIESLQARIKTMAEEHADELMVAHLDGRMRGRSTEPAAVDHDEDLLEKLYWGFDSQRKKTGEERLAFKVKVRFYASEFLRRSDGKMTFAQSVSDDMMNLADRLGSEFDDVDPRAWKHLLVYAPKAAPQQESQEPDFWTVCAQYEDGDKTGWVPLPWYSSETELGVKDLVLKAVRREGYKGMASERLQELGWEIRPVYLAPQSSYHADRAARAQADSVTAPATESYVQPVPDKCDRIVWRGHYYHLPPAQAADSVLEDASRYRWLRERSSTMFVNISINGEGAEIAATLDSAVDAARKQGANHD